MKLDRQKVYENVEWNFVLKVLSLFGFSPIFGRLVEQCITTICYSILLKGILTKKILSKLSSQGDPLSRYLFILVFEVLSRLLVKVELNGKIHGVKLLIQGPSTSH